MTRDTNNEQIKVIQSLHDLERRLLRFLDKPRTIEELAKLSSFDKTSIMRALQWLTTKRLVKLETSQLRIVKPSDLGKHYQSILLPEQRLLNTLKSSNELPYEKLLRLSRLSQQEFQAALGVLKPKGIISIKRTGQGLFIGVTEYGKTIDVLPETELLKKLPIAIDKIPSNEQQTLNALLSRKKILNIEPEKEIIVVPSKRCVKLSRLSIEQYIDITPEVIKQGLWKRKKLRVLNTETPVPKLLHGRRHLIDEAERFIRNIWIGLGFKEMTGHILQPSFWNFDALFVPQDHPAREMQDSYYLNLKTHEIANIEQDIVKEVKKAHETGVDNSTGWGYNWDLEKAKSIVLRTHTTVLSVRTIAQFRKHQKIPAKFFAIGHVFRNETLDWKHLFDFIQVEGIVIDKKADMRQLIAYLKLFYNKLGYPNVKIRASYFPYTEPSAEVMVLHNNEWLELGGCGILRPEVVKPLLGKYVPVLAWGLGLERAIVLKYGIKDLREIYNNNLKFLRYYKAWV